MPEYGEWKVITPDMTYLVDYDNNASVLVLGGRPPAPEDRRDDMASLAVLLGEELVHWADAETLYSVLDKVGIDCPFRVPN